MRRYFILIIITCFCISCHNTVKISHRGANKSQMCNISIDTIKIPLRDASGWGCFYMEDSVITFADEITCTFMDFNLNGELITSYFTKGRGKNEILALSSVSPIYNDRQRRGIIIDNNNSVTIFDRESKDILQKGQLDFGWGSLKQREYGIPGLYNIMQLSDFGLSVFMESDSVLVIPVSIINRMTKDPTMIESDRYEKGAIFGRLDLSSMKVTDVFGHFPEIYKENPMPHLESFNYIVSGDTMYVNHIVDSLIYVYEYPDRLVYTLGYECSDINRDYTVTKKISTGEIAKEDMKHAGMNSGLYYSEDTGILCRTYMRSLNTGASGMQMYKGVNLIADLEMPQYFKLLGYYDGYWYGCRIIPLENMDTTSLVLYKMHIDIAM